MKVILLEDVKSLGKKGQIVEVNTGYARNFVLPKGLGVEATGKNLNDLKLKNANDKKVAAENLAVAQKLAESLKDKEVKATMKVGEGGKVFGSVSSKEIAELCKSQLNLEVDKKKILIKDPIRSIGTTIVGIKLHPEVTAELRVHVTEA